MEGVLWREDGEGERKMKVGDSSGNDDGVECRDERRTKVRREGGEECGTIY